jgi:general secretion pathway protein L
MKLVEQIREAFSLWIDCVADALTALRRRFSTSHTLHLVEGSDSAFTALSADGAPQQDEPARVRIVDGALVGVLPEAFRAQAPGNCIEVVLQPSRFMFRPLELPHRAAEYLDGIVRSQIDRLTPWPAEDAAFGWSGPSEIANDRIVVTVAATARASIVPLVQSLAGLGAGSIAISTLPPDQPAGATSIKVFEQKGRAALQIQRLRRALVAVLLVAALAAALAYAVDGIVGGSLQARQDDVVRKIAADQASIRARIGGGGDSARAGLERRKEQTPSSVIVLEALSRIFPDDTYVTELRIAGNKMQVVGITRDAPSLIRLIAQSSYFTQASFFAPTTRSPSQRGENFHIEAQILPVFTPPS